MEIDSEVPFKTVYVGHIRTLIFDPNLAEMRKTNFANFIDRVTDVFEYMIDHFEESKNFLTPNFRETSCAIAMSNLGECKNICMHRNKPPEVLERVAYLSYVLERFLSLLRE